MVKAFITKKIHLVMKEVGQMIMLMDLGLFLSEALMLKVFGEMHSMLKLLWSKDAILMNLIIKY